MEVPGSCWLSAPPAHTNPSSRGPLHFKPARVHQAFLSLRCPWVFLQQSPASSSAGSWKDTVAFRGSRDCVGTTWMIRLLPQPYFKCNKWQNHKGRSLHTQISEHRLSAVGAQHLPLPSPSALTQCPLEHKTEKSVPFGSRVGSSKRRWHPVQEKAWDARHSHQLSELVSLYVQVVTVGARYPSGVL